MEICNTAPLYMYKHFPAIIEGNSKIIVREAVICDAKRREIEWLQHLHKEVILWFDNYLPENEILPIAATFESKKIMIPAATLEDIDEIERVFPKSPLHVIVIPKAKDEYTYLAIIGRILRSQEIIGIGFDYEYVLTSFQKRVSPSYLGRVKAIEYINMLYGLSLYDKEFYCMRMLGALSEIVLLKKLPYVNALITDIALSCARSYIKLDDTNLLPTDFNEDFIKKHHIDDPDIVYEIDDIFYKTMMHNMKTLRDHNE